MDKFEDTVVNPNISLKNFEVKVRDDVQDSTESTRHIPASKKKDKNYQKSIFLLVLLAAILIYQVSINI